MKNAVYMGLAILVLTLLSVPGWAQKGGRGGGAGKAAMGASRGKVSSQRPATAQAPQSVERSNKGGEVRGRERAVEVQSMNTKADAERGFSVAPGLEKGGKGPARGVKEKDKERAEDRERGREKDRERDMDESKDQ